MKRIKIEYKNKTFEATTMKSAKQAASDFVDMFKDEYKLLKTGSTRNAIPPETFQVTISYARV